MEKVKDVLLIIAVVVVFLLIMFWDRPDKIEYVSCLNCGQEYAFKTEEMYDDNREYAVYNLCEGCGYCKAIAVVGDGVVKVEDIREQLKKSFPEWEAEEIAEIILEKEISQGEFADMMYDVWK